MVVKDLSKKSRLPLKDTEVSTGRGQPPIEIQGVCDSELREDEDEPWVNPYPDVFVWHED